MQNTGFVILNEVKDLYIINTQNVRILHFVRNDRFLRFYKGFGLFNLPFLMEILLGIILFFVIIYYAFKLFLRYGLPWVLARFMRKQQEKYNQQQNHQNARSEGDVSIKSNASKKGKDDNGFGEYVDFEDIQE